jgi:hypothetical protein
MHESDGKVNRLGYPGSFQKVGKPQSDPQPSARRITILQRSSSPVLASQTQNETLCNYTLLQIKLKKYFQLKCKKQTVNSV